MGGGQIGKKSLICIEGKPNDPSLGEHCSLLFLPATPLSLSGTPGLLELTRRLSRALDSPRALLPELQRIKDTVRCALLGAEVPVSRTIDANLDCAFVENAFFHRNP